MKTNQQQHKKVKDICCAFYLHIPSVKTNIKKLYRTKREACGVLDFVSINIKESVINTIQKNEPYAAWKQKGLIWIKYPIRGVSCYFISELLTKKVYRNLYLAREHDKNKRLAAAWASFGKVYIKKE